MLITIGTYKPKRYAFLPGKNSLYRRSRDLNSQLPPGQAGERLLARLEREFGPRRLKLLQARAEGQKLIDGGQRPDFLASTRAAAVVYPDGLSVNPDCGLKTRRWEEVLPALRNMTAAAKRMREAAASR